MGYQDAQTLALAAFAHNGGHDARALCYPSSSSATQFPIEDKVGTLGAQHVFNSS